MDIIEINIDKVCEKNISDILGKTIGVVKGKANEFLYSVILTEGNEHLYHLTTYGEDSVMQKLWICDNEFSTPREKMVYICKFHGHQKICLKRRRFGSNKCTRDEYSSTI